MICIVKYFAGNAVGSASGLVNGACQCAGIIAPTIMGLILDMTHSYAAVFGMVIFIELIAVFISFTVNTKVLMGHPIAEDYVAEDK
jgi:cyanate permease